MEKNVAWAPGEPAKWGAGPKWHLIRDGLAACNPDIYIHKRSGADILPQWANPCLRCRRINLKK